MAKHLTEDQRAEIRGLHALGWTYKAIGQHVGRAASTIRSVCDERARLQANEDAKRWRQQNPERQAYLLKRWAETEGNHWQQEYYRQNKKRILQHATEWREKNCPRLTPEQKAEKKARSQENKRRCSRNQERRRRARKRDAHIDGHTAKQLASHLSAWHGHCAYCFESTDVLGLHVDHVVPLAKGGDHALWNLVPACPSCNQAKEAKLPGTGFQLPWWP